MGKQLITRTSALGFALALGTTLGVGNARAAEQIQYPYRVSGLVGIAGDQIARLTAVDVSDEAEIAQLIFVDTDGRVIKQSSVTLQPGQAGFLDVTLADQVTAAAVNRLELRGVIDTLPAVQTSEFPPDPCETTLEVIAADGHTLILDPGFRRLGRSSLNPQPPPP